MTVKKMLEKLYSDFKLKDQNYHTIKKQLSKYEKIDNEKLFLYFIQEGKSLYSGKPLNIEDLETYEVDHIIPQTLIKDNSIDNKALVLREENQTKAANFVLPPEYRNENMKVWWKHLKENKLMSAKKFHNLCRTTYSEDDIAGFINRQLVETRQITIHVANIIKNFYQKTNVLYLPAALSRNYREKFELFKFREINDFHHAHDAYLTAVLGEYKTKVLKKSFDFTWLKEYNQILLKNKKYKELHYGYVINSLDSSILHYDKNGEIIFDNTSFNQTVENTIYRNDILISKKVEFRTGELYNQTKNKKGKAGVPLKAGLTTNLYGSYTSINPAYAASVKYTYKNKEKQKLVGIPIYIDINGSADLKLQYLRTLLKLSNDDTVEIVKDKIPFFSIINWNGKMGYLVGASDKVEICNAKEFTIDKNHMKEWKYSFERLFHNKTKIIADHLYQHQLEDIICYIVLKIEKEYLLYQNLVEDMKIMFAFDDMSLLNLEQKENIVRQMLKLLNCKSDTANMKFLDNSYSMAFGKKNGLIIEHANIVHQSITGIRKHTDEF